jgi:hypothetical protein
MDHPIETEYGPMVVERLTGQPRIILGFQTGHGAPTGNPRTGFQTGHGAPTGNPRTGFQTGRGAPNGNLRTGMTSKAKFVCVAAPGCPS